MAAAHLEVVALHACSVLLTTGSTQVSRPANIVNRLRWPTL